MRWFFKIFFKLIRIILGPFVLLYEIITAPKGVIRPVEKQQQVDHSTRDMTLYQYRTCPFCLKVRHAIKRLSLNISRCDAQYNAACRDKLQQHGGRVQVPCLRISGKDGKDTWLYESSEIIRYLDHHFAE